MLELSHELDLALWLGGEAVSVFARLARLSDLELDVEDTVEMVVTLRDGGLAACTWI